MESVYENSVVIPHITHVNGIHENKVDGIYSFCINFVGGGKFDDWYNHLEIAVAQREILIKMINDYWDSQRPIGR